MGRKRSDVIDGQQLNNHVLLGVLARVVPADVVDDVLRRSGRQNWRARHLLPRLVVYYVMALTLYAHALYDAVLRELVEGLRWLGREGTAGGLVCKSAITQARIRLGEAPLRELFGRLARPLAEPGTPGAWYRGLWLVSFEGTTLDIPDVPELKRHFGRPAASRGSSGFPQLRLLARLETGTHAIFAAGHRRACNRGGPPGAGDRASSAARHAVSGRPRLPRLRPVAGSRGHRRRSALARAPHRGASLPAAPGRRFLSEPPLSLIPASPARP